MSTQLQEKISKVKDYTTMKREEFLESLSSWVSQLFNITIKIDGCFTNLSTESLKLYHFIIGFF